jgi:hyperosmotically inducible periplasmic protein
MRRLLLAAAGTAVAVTLGAAQVSPDLEEREAKRMSVMANDIRKAIVTLPNYGLFDDVRFSINRANVVTLKGYASRPTLKASAENAAKNVRGVEKVDNRIEVLPLSPQDDDIRFRVYVAVYGHPALARYNPNRGTPLFNSLVRRTAGITQDPPPGNHPIHIIVKNGNVTLEGVVDNEGDRSIAEIRANGVPGAFRVDNEIRLSSGRRR